jgi:hypothetical protein
MLDGTMCEGCGEFMDIGGEPPGYPVRCAACGEEPDDSQPVNYKPPKTVPCPHVGCERMFRSRQAAGQHWTDKHGD